MVRFSVYVVQWPSVHVSRFEFDKSQGPQNTQNKSSEKHFFAKKIIFRLTFIIPGLALTSF